MLNSIIEDVKFAEVMQQNIQNLIMYLFERDQNFGVLCKLEHTRFEPELPEYISSEFRHMTLFYLAGYTFESANIIDDELVFEAGFGAENFGSIVSVPIGAIMQVIVEDTPILINISNYQKTEVKTISKDALQGVQNSMASFLSNPENSKFLKK